MAGHQHPQGLLTPASPATPSTTASHCVPQSPCLLRHWQGRFDGCVDGPPNHGMYGTANNAPLSPCPLQGKQPTLVDACSLHTPEPQLYACSACRLATQTHRATTRPPSRTILGALEHRQPLPLILCCEDRGRQQGAGRLLQQRVEAGAGAAHRAVDDHHKVGGGGAAG